MSQAIKVNRTLTGRVISNKMDKTINVSIERKVKHPKYGKYLNVAVKSLLMTLKINVKKVISLLSRRDGRFLNVRPGRLCKW